jgi:putative oligomerization/nucleic acid binding protein
MALIRKALYVATLGLSGLVFKDDSKEKAKKERTAKAAEKLVRPRKQTKRTAGAQTKRARRPAPRAASASTAAQTIGSGNGAINELESLAELHRSGALSDEEFAAAKVKILGTSPTPQESRTDPAFPAVEANVAAARHLGDLAIHDGGAPVATFSSD